MFEIEKDIPLPELAAPYTKYPFRTMKPGDSFLVPCSQDKIKSQKSSIYMSARRVFGAVKHVVIRPVEGGIRVWRVK